jgi:hypothetical protein
MTDAEFACQYTLYTGNGNLLVTGASRSVCSSAPIKNCGWFLFSDTVEDVATNTTLAPNATVTDKSAEESGNASGNVLKAIHRWGLFYVVL